jgi:hypothetical protein
MSSLVPRALTRVAAAIVGLALLAGTPAAIAKPPTRPGAVTNLTVAVTKPAAAYNLESSWTAGANTTSFRVQLTNAAGAVLDSATLASTHWTATTTAPGGSVLTVTVTPYNSSRKGPSTPTTTTLPDVTGPSGSYTVDDAGYDGTITQASLSDDVSPASAITRSVGWGDGSPAEPWSSGDTISHNYATQGRYLPTMTLTDLAGNTTVLDLKAIVINDHAAPTGTFSTTPATGWASYTAVALTQLTLSDDFSPAPNIARSVEWGDGTVSPWPAGGTISHRYLVAGTFTPQVVATDEAGNSAPLAAGSSVTITKDALAPVLRLTLPRTKATSVRSWKVLKGRATDAGVGVRWVQLKAVQKRGKVFYAYRPATRTWVKARTSVAAFTKAGVLRVTPGTTGLWQAPLARLTLGTLTYRVTGVDQVGNTSKTLAHSQKITKR